MKASDIFIKALENEGVEYIFGVPGEENLDFLESLRQSKTIKLILTRHEQGAAFMAATYGRLTGKTGVCLATLGPGATNLVTGAAYAQLAGMPILMITGQKPIKKSKQGQFQIIDVVDMMRPITKFTKQIVNVHTIPPLIRECFRKAEDERPGAVHLEFPEDIASEDAEPFFIEPHPVRRPIAEHKAINKAVSAIEKARHPLLLIGAGSNRKMITKTLTAFVEKTGMYFFNTQMGAGVIDERHPLFLGTAALSSQDYLHYAIDEADCIINVGHDVVEKPPFFMEPDGQTVIHVNFSRSPVDEVYFPQIEVIGDIANAIWQMTEAISPQSHWDFSYHKKVKDESEKHIQARSEEASFPMLPQRLVADCREAMPEDAILTLDNGVYKIWFSRNYKAYQNNTLLLDNALATMGAGLPSAIGAKIIHPSRKVMAVCGDGGFMMNSQEIETAVRLKLDLVVLILKDDAYGMIKWKQAGMGFPNWGLDYGNPDFVKYAESYGANGHRVTKTEEFLSLLQKCLDSTGVHIIEAPIDYSQNEKVLIDELKNSTKILH